MTDTPSTDAERLAQMLLENAPHVEDWQDGETGEDVPLESAMYEAAALLRAQAAEIERLEQTLEDIACGRGAFGISAERDFQWAVNEASRALNRRAALKEKTDG